MKLFNHQKEENTLVDFIKKPILSREGANITIIKDGKILEETKGMYGAEDFICQQLFECPSFGNQIPILGSWVIGQEAAGMGIRETSGLITGNTSCFVPHLINE